MKPLSQRPQYGPEQYHEYLKYIGAPTITASEQSWDNSRTSATEQSPHDVDRSSDRLRRLQDLQRFQLAKVPFENLSLHYSSHKVINIDPRALFVKIVRQGRGGYCMENNCFFGTMLRSSGYDVCSVGARVHEGDGLYTGWSHMVNIVVLDGGQQYLVDVGFGHSGPTQPLLLMDGHEEQGIPPASMRLVRGKIEVTTNPNDRLWIYQHRPNSTSDWQPIYCFSETEFLPQDYEMMNFWTSQNRKSFFTYRIMCVKLIMDEKTFELVGTLILVGDEVKKTIGEKTEQVKICRTEGERVQALEDLFGIKLTEEEKRGIRGTATALSKTNLE